MKAAIGGADGSPGSHGTNVERHTVVDQFSGNRVKPATMGAVDEDRLRDGTDPRYGLS